MEQFLFHLIKILSLKNLKNIPLYVRPKKMTQTGTNVVESILNSIEWFEKEIKI